MILYTTCGTDDDNTSPETPLLITLILTDSADRHSPGPVDYMSGCFIPTASEFSIGVGEIESWEKETYWPGFVANVVGKAIGFG